MKKFCIIAVPLVLALNGTVAEDFKTVNGKEYKNATVTRVEPDGIVLKTKSGISKIYFVELPKEVPERFNYSPASASAYQASEQEAFSKQQRQKPAPKSSDAAAGMKAPLNERATPLRV